jgi:hypothetical protein
MKLSRSLNYASYVGVLLSYIVTGLAASFVIPVYQHALNSDLPGHPLPGLMLAILIVFSDSKLLIADILLGVLFSGILFYMERSTTMSAYAAAFLSLVLLFNWFQLLTLFVGLSMPFVTLIYKG